MDRSIHGNLIMFVALLLANNCFHLHDIVIYIIRPILRYILQSEGSPHAPLVLEFVNSLILHLFVRDHTEGVAEVGTEGRGVMLPQFVQHCLEAKCRDLNLGYALMLLKDLVKINSQRSGVKAESLLVHSNSSTNEVGISKVCACVCV